MKRGKKYKEAAKQVDRTVTYEPAEAVALAKKTAVAKFDETIEVHNQNRLRWTSCGAADPWRRSPS